ncbi:hypothetical protein D3C83_01180 [compost metagenome]
MRPLAGKIGDHAELPVLCGRRRNAGCRAHPRLRAIGARHQARRKLGAVVEPQHGMVIMKFQAGPAGGTIDPDILAAHGFPQHMLQPAVFDDEGELAQPGVIGAELEAGARVIAIHPHRLDPGQALLRQASPRATALEKRGAARADRIDAVIPGVFPGDRARRLGFDEREGKPAARERAHETQANQPAADNDDIERVAHKLNLHGPFPCSLARQYRNTKLWFGIRDWYGRSGYRSHNHWIINLNSAEIQWLT